jgi:hypothetical protein
LRVKPKSKQNNYGGHVEKKLVLTLSRFARQHSQCAIKIEFQNKFSLNDGTRLYIQDNYKDLDNNVSMVIMGLQPSTDSASKEIDPGWHYFFLTNQEKRKIHATLLTPVPTSAQLLVLRSSGFTTDVGENGKKKKAAQVATATPTPKTTAIRHGSPKSGRKTSRPTKACPSWPSLRIIDRKPESMALWPGLTRNG